MGTKIGTLQDRTTGDDFLPKTDASLVKGLEDLSTIRRLSNGALQYTLSGEADPVNPAEYESVTNKTTELDNESTDIEYPSAKAVVDALGKWGVISQTLTWANATDGGKDYTISNIVRGIIPQVEINIYKNLGATFNSNTGYFGINGITDIALDEIRLMYKHFSPVILPLQFYGFTGRTIFPQAGQSAVTVGALFRNASHISFLPGFYHYPYITNYGNDLFYGCSNLVRCDMGIYNPSSSLDFFYHCYRLEYVMISSLQRNIFFTDSPNLTVPCVANMVNNRSGSAAVTITLHATAYARCQADTATYTYNSNTYTGILAYAAAKNITIASA